MNHTRLARLALIAACCTLLQCNSSFAQRRIHGARTSLQTKAYFFGKLDGELAPPLMALLHPSRWQGQTDGAVLMPASALSTLTKKQQDALASCHRKGLPVMITSADQEQIERLNSSLGLGKTSDLPQGLKYLDFYASTLSRHGFRSFLMAPSRAVNQSEVSPAENRSDLYSRTQQFLKWIRDTKSGGRRMAHASQTMPVQIYNNIASWQITFSQPVQYYWASCGTPTNSCTNNYTLTASVWPVYSQSNATFNAQNPSQTQQPTDYFIMSLSGNLSSAKCFGFYNLSHPTHISAYWARQYNVSAAVQNNWPNSDLNIAPQWSPQAADPGTSVTTGTTWSVGGTGTAGTSGSVAFNAGVAFNKTASVSYPALQVQPNIGSSSQSLNVASWTYDSWNYVQSTIKPSGSCPSSFNPLPPIISSGTFSSQDTWVWQAYSAVRQKYGVVLPVQIDFSVLLGWAYYFGFESNCKPKGPNLGQFPLQNMPGSSGAYQVGISPIQGLTFDVGGQCQNPPNYGTIPLGPTKNQNWSAGNPGTPYSAIPVWVIYPPFAPTSVSQ
jgi:hypothetical protein